jgi:RNA-binding protein YhbY
MAKVDTKPSDGMVSEAKRGLAWREEFGRGGTEVGIARARDIANRKSLSEKTINRMVSFFARHEVDKKAEGFRPGEKGYPSNGRIAWALWGGDAGKSWAKKKQGQLDKDRSSEQNAENVLDSLSEDEPMNDVETEITEDVVAEVAEEVAEEVTEEITDRSVEEIIEPRSLYEEEQMLRSGLLSAEEVDARRVKIAVSSEEPVERSFGKEILEHSEEAIDLSFLASGRAPLLLDHDPEKQIGVIESVDLDGSARRLRATVRFGKNGLAKEILDDVNDGIRANISVGYSINKMVKKDDAYIAKSWRPVEASIVSIPADVTVGVGRSSETSQPTPPIEIKETEMSDVENTVDVEAVKAEAAKTAQRNAADIVALGARHNQSKMAEKAIAEGRSIE